MKPIFTIFMLLFLSRSTIEIHEEIIRYYFEITIFLYYTYNNHAIFRHAANGKKYLS